MALTALRSCHALLATVQHAQLTQEQFRQLPFMLLWWVCCLQGPRDSLGSYSRMGTMSPAKSAVRECLLGQLHDMYISLCKQVSHFD